MNITAKQYAQSFYQELSTPNELDSIIRIFEILNENPKALNNILKDPKLNAKEKRNLLEKLEVPAKIINFLLILEKSGHLDHLERIILALKHLRDQKSNSLEVTIETAEELTSEEITNLTHSLKQKFSANIKLKTKINPDLLGGILIKAGDIIIDNSLKNKLQIMKNELVKE